MGDVMGVTQPANLPLSARLATSIAGLPQLVLVTALMVGVVASCRLQIVRDWLSIGEVTTSLALGSVGIGVIGATLCGVLGQLADEAQGLWLGAGMTLYSVVAIPAATVNANTGFGEAAVGNVRLVAHITAVAIAFAAVRVPSRPRWDGWFVIYLGLAVAAAAAGVGKFLPGWSLAVTTNPTVRFSVCALWAVSGLSLVAAGWSRRPSWLIWVGLGWTVIAVAHILRVSAGSPQVPLGLTFSALRMFGLLVLLAGVAPSARRALLDVHAARDANLAELRTARRGLQEAAERDHEVRAGLAGLAGVAALLDSGVRSKDETDTLREAVAAELERLRFLVRAPGPDGQDQEPREYEVEPVLRQQVALHASSGMDIRLDAERGLCANGNPRALAQVLKNLLTNCTRHAAGSPVRIRASRRECWVVIRVCDFGPGIPARFERRAFELGACGPRSAGQGFGLHISRRLIEEESGRIYLKPRPVSGTGCTVIVQLPLGKPVEASLRGQRPPSVAL
jgi:two-component system OmpR family sensor kinase